MRKIVDRGIIIRNTEPRAQIDEVLDRLDLRSMCRPFSRCMECNGGIVHINSDDIKFITIQNRIPEGVLNWCREFFLCDTCGNIYWKGSHFEKLKGYVDDILKTDK
jgi:hypothetical protein